MHLLFPCLHFFSRFPESRIFWKWCRKGNMTSVSKLDKDCRRWWPNESNRPFPSSPGPLYQNEVKPYAFDREMIFHSRASKTHFQKKGCTLGLILKVRVSVELVNVYDELVSAEHHYRSWHSCPTRLPNTLLSPCYIDKSLMVFCMTLHWIVNFQALKGS